LTQRSFRRRIRISVPWNQNPRILNDFNGFSDETADSAPRYTNRLETRSEYITPSRPTFADGGHLKRRVRSEAKRHDNPGTQRSHSLHHLHAWSRLIPQSKACQPPNKCNAIGTANPSTGLLFGGCTENRRAAIGTEILLSLLKTGCDLLRVRYKLCTISVRREYKRGDLQNRLQP
jgi:hypothetical protein